ncbi:cysteine hydrolase [Brevibacillus sp. SYP-B805]|uniref:cysteine hydrolase family protein n=1 Tax=Brevibacillus sp. SYP-B805 TaxID=1578199 RepID=UPI0013EE128E|nr:cysteine hydrolase family protein [Brevibacillus sp. SYP-B805]NGQ95128.1 cysteine hydrolase [Brevibacillus sp. SYP-B805]
MVPFEKNAALLLIDVQHAFDHPSWGSRNNPDAEENMAKILAVWRETNRPVIHIQHVNPSPESLFSTPEACEIKAMVAPTGSEPVIRKQVNSAFIGTNLEALLASQGIKTLVIVGLTTDHCVSTTTRMAKNLGFSPVLIADATATFNRVGHDGKHYTAEEIHRMNLVSLHEEFAAIMTTEQLLQMARA